MTMELLDDPALIALASSSDAALTELLARYTVDICATAQAAIPLELRPDMAVEDMVQDVFLVLMRALPSFDPGKGTFGAWLGGVTRNSVKAAAKILRRDKVHRLAEPSSEEESEDWLAAIALARSGEQPERIAARNEVAAVVQRLLARLPNQDRELLTRHHLNGESLATLGMELGISKAAVAMRLYRIRADCRSLLGTDNGSRFLGQRSSEGE